MADIEIDLGQYDEKDFEAAPDYSSLLALPSGDYPAKVYDVTSIKFGKADTYEDGDGVNIQLRITDEAKVEGYQGVFFYRLYLRPTWPKGSKNFALPVTLKALAGKTTGKITLNHNFFADAMGRDVTIRLVKKNPDSYHDTEWNDVRAILPAGTGGSAKKPAARKAVAKKAAPKIETLDLSDM